MPPAAVSTPGRVVRPARASTPQRHVFKEPLVIRPMSPMRRFWGTTCRGGAIACFWLLVLLLLGRILAPGLYLAGTALVPAAGPAIVEKVQADGSTVQVLSPQHEATLVALSTCAGVGQGGCPFASAGDVSEAAVALEAVQGKLGQVEQLKTEVAALQTAVDMVGKAASGAEEAVTAKLAELHDGKLAELEAAVAALQSAVAGLQAWQSEQTAATDAAAAAVSEAAAQSKEELAGVHSAVKGVADDVSSLKEQVTALDGQVAAASLAVAAASVVPATGDAPAPVVVAPDTQALQAAATEAAEAHVAGAVAAQLSKEEGALAAEVKRIVADALQEALPSDAPPAVDGEVVIAPFVADLMAKAVQQAAADPATAAAAAAAVSGTVEAAVKEAAASAPVAEAAAAAVEAALPATAQAAAERAVEAALGPWESHAKEVVVAAGVAAAQAAAAEAGGGSGGDTDGLARQFPSSVSLDTLGATLVLGDSASSGTGDIAAAKAAIAQHCPKAEGAVPPATGVSVQDLLLDATGSNAHTGLAVPAPPGTAASRAQCALAKAALTAFSLPDGSRAGSNPAWLLQGTRPVGGDAWAPSTAGAHATVELPSPRAVRRVGVLFPTSHQAPAGVPCRPAHITAVCLQEGGVPASLAAGALQVDEAAGEAWLEASGPPCARVKVAFRAAGQEPVCVHRLVLQE